MKRIAIAALLCLGAVTAQAQTRIDATGMSCAQIRAALDRNGVAVISQRSKRNPSFSSSATYVRDGRYCGIGQTLQPASVAAADTGNCYVQRCMSNGSRSR
jgi:hypothetical protein